VRPHELFLEVQRPDTSDLHGGKLCKALNRQHPRDLFDIMHLQAAIPFPDPIQQAFVVYLASHRRPIAELLVVPKPEAIEDLFASHFAGMTDEHVEMAELKAVMTKLFEWTASALTE